MTKLWAILKGIGTALNIIRWFQKDKDRKAAEQVGENKQKVANLKKDKANAAKAKKIREDVDRADESELDDGLRKYARKPRK